MHLPSRVLRSSMHPQVLDQPHPGNRSTTWAKNQLKRNQSFRTYKNCWTVLVMQNSLLNDHDI